MSFDANAMHRSTLILRNIPHGTNYNRLLAIKRGMYLPCKRRWQDDFIEYAHLGKVVSIVDSALYMKWADY